MEDPSEDERARGHKLSITNENDHVVKDIVSS